MNASGPKKQVDTNKISILQYANELNTFRKVPDSVS